MKKYLLLIVFFILTLQIKAQTVSDADGNTYNTVTIGTQVWMKQNLKVTKYNNSTVIPNITDKSVWKTLTTPAYCWYNNEVTNKATYGALYNWYTVSTNNLCPEGWHVPSQDEFNILYTYLGGDSIAGSKLKEAGNTHWTQFNTDASNSSGFTGLPGGYLDYFYANFKNIYYIGYFWSKTEHNTDSSFAIGLVTNEKYILHSYTIKKNGFSVRCIKDSAVTSAPIIGDQSDNYFYPNPATDKLYLDNNRLHDALVVIFDLHGKQVISRRIDSNPIDISNLSKGVYLVKIIDSGNIIMEKLIKE